MAKKTGKVSLINRKGVKEYIVRKAEATRFGWDCNRVSKQALDDIESFIRSRIDRAIHSHPSKGKTFSQFQP